MDYVKSSLNISANLFMKIILVNPNLYIFLILIMVRILENNCFLVRTKLAYLRDADIMVFDISSFLTKSIVFEKTFHIVLTAKKVDYIYKEPFNLHKIVG